MELLQLILIFYSLVTSYPAFYFFGALICGGAWFVSRRWHVIFRSLIRSVFLALLLAPGVGIGHGFAFMPAAYAVYGSIVMRDRHDVGFEGLGVLIGMWLIILLALFSCSMVWERKYGRYRVSPHA
jgi:hypothetical protein